MTGYLICVYVRDFVGGHAFTCPQYTELLFLKTCVILLMRANVCLQCEGLYMPE